MAEALHARWPAAAAGGEPPARLHLTLHFLGAVAPALLPPLLAVTARPCSAFALRFTGCERWPRGLWVARPDPVPPGLLALHAELALALAALGLRTDPRAFQPHVKSARRHAGACAPPPPT